MKGKIYINQTTNDLLFDQKLPTWRNGFCYISRCISDITETDSMIVQGWVKIKGRKFRVIETCDEWIFDCRIDSRTGQAYFLYED